MFYVVEKLSARLRRRRGASTVPKVSGDGSAT
jgi:hypothetical protein